MGPENEPGTRRCLLVVDDHKDSADSLAMLLRRAGHEARTTYGGVNAVAMAARLQPDAVLLDLGMPELDGYEACRRMREENRGRPMLLVALTGRGEEADRRRTEAAGFDAHLVKPVDPASLMKLLNSLPPGRSR